MKLYTEKQLREAIAQGYDWCHNKYIPSDNMIDIFIKQLNTIEIPSNDDLEKLAWRFSKRYRCYVFRTENLIKGAQWMRNKILNK